MTIRSRHEAVQRHRSLFTHHRNECSGIGFADHRGDPVEFVVGCGPGKGRAIVSGNVEMNIRERERRPGQPIRDVPPLSRSRLEEFAARGYGGKEVGDLDARADRCAGDSLVLDHSRFDAQLEGLGRIAWPTAQSQPRHRCDCGQGLPTETVSPNLLEVRHRSDLAGRVTPQGHARVLRTHPGTVVRHGDPIRPAPAGFDANPARARVERVLDELLDDGSRPFDDLPGRNLVD